MDKPAIIYVNLDAKCKRCKQDGATQNGLCMKCIADDVKNGKYDDILKPLQDKLRKGLISKKPHGKD